MNDYLKRYRLTLRTKGPVFIGSGREFSKKEYVFMPGGKVGIVEMEKLYRFLSSRHLARQFEEYMLKDYRTDLGKWLINNRIGIKEITPFMRYLIEKGDTERDSRTQIMECIKDPYGKPYIPGSSLKGMFRTILLAKQMTDDQDGFAQERQATLSGISRDAPRRIYLNSEVRKLQEKAFHTLARPDTKPSDMVNDKMSGFIVSDSEPLSTDDLVLCQKVEYHTDGMEKRLNLLRECIRPGTDIHATLTIDESEFRIDRKEILDAVCAFGETYYEVFLRGFRKMDMPMMDEVFLGGGAGFVSKTVLYPLLGKKQGLDAAMQIFSKTNVPDSHKHYRDRQLGVSPHIVKCTYYKGGLYQMGACRLTIEEG